MPNVHELIDGRHRKSYSTKETAQCIREALKAAFPGFKFSVTTSYASMTSSTRIRWTDGPTEPEVERITNRFTSRGFDGMTDSSTYHDQEFNGERVSFSGWVTTNREYSPELLTRALARFQAMRAEYGLAPADLTITTGSYPHVDGRDANAEARVNSFGYRYPFRCCSDAVQSIAHHMRSNGCLVFLKDR